MRIGAQELAAPPPTASLSFSFETAAFRVVTNDAWTRRILSRAYAALCVSAAGDAPVAHILAGAAALNVSYRSWNAQYAFAEFGPFGAAFCAVRDLSAHVFGGITNAAACYGAAGVYGGSAFAVLGPTTAGKTTLMMHLLENGARFLGDETFLLRAGTINAVPRRPAFREPSLRFLPPALASGIASSPAYAQFETGRLWYAVAPEHLCGIAADPTPLPCNALFVLQRGERAHVTPLSRADALSAVMNAHYRKPRHLQDAARVAAALDDVRGFRVEVADPAETAKRVMDAVTCN